MLRIELLAAEGIVDGQQPVAVRLAAQHVGKARRALERRAVVAPARQRELPQEHQTVGVYKRTQLDGQPAA